MGDEFISQEEIDALLNGENLDNTSNSNENENSQGLNNAEIDALGELGNIGMGTSATTLSNILGKKTEITTPIVKTISSIQLKEDYKGDYVAVKIEYIKGVKGLNYLVLNQNDVKIITDLMMGGDGSNTDEEIAELHLSAIGEAMNQMIGSAATSLAQTLSTEIDISPPSAQLINASDDKWELAGLLEHKDLVFIGFKIKIEDLIDSNIFQVQSLEFAKEQAAKLFSVMAPEEKEDIKVEDPKVKDDKAEDSRPLENNENVSSEKQVDIGATELEQESSFQNQMQESKNNDMGSKNTTNNKFIDVQPANFQAFDEGKVYLDKKNIDIIMDVPLQVSVELGRTKRLIKDILKFGSGSIVELDKLAEEPVDILANGKIVAKGEVVVIDENFGVRITEIVQSVLCV